MRAANLMCRSALASLLLTPSGCSHRFVICQPQLLRQKTMT